ncbi:MAG: Abi family protein [Thermomicrobiales bacterium]|nr:Abi family protein [Thermomicrobiales bacterium]
MVAQLVADLHTTLSQIRLDSYRPVGGSDREMVLRYFWDMELSRALVTSLHAVELALRNSIYDGLTARFQGNDMWFYLPGVLEHGQLSQLSTALRELAQERSPATSGRIVAKLTLGFWVTLISNPYEAKLWQPQGFALLRTVFPAAHGLPIQAIHTRYNNIRKLRNRVSHHEAVWDRVNLLQDHVDLQEAIGWISPPLQQAVASIDEFLPIYNHGRGYLDTELRLQTRGIIP